MRWTDIQRWTHRGDVDGWIEGGKNNCWAGTIRYQT